MLQFDCYAWRGICATFVVISDSFTTLSSIDLDGSTKTTLDEMICARMRIVIIRIGATKGRLSHVKCYVHRGWKRLSTFNKEQHNVQQKLGCMSFTPQSNPSQAINWILEPLIRIVLPNAIKFPLLLVRYSLEINKIYHIYAACQHVYRNCQWLLPAMPRGEWFVDSTAFHILLRTWRTQKINERQAFLERYFGMMTF